MRLRAIRRIPNPGYPTFEAFHASRERQLARLAQGAGLLLAAGTMSGCDRSGADTPAGLPGTPPPPPPIERLRGEIAVPVPPQGAAAKPAKCPPGTAVPQPEPPALLGIPPPPLPQPPPPPAGVPPPPKPPAVEKPAALEGDIAYPTPPRLPGQPQTAQPAKAAGKTE